MSFSSLSKHRVPLFTFTIGIILYMYTDLVAWKGKSDVPHQSIPSFGLLYNWFYVGG